MAKPLVFVLGDSISIHYGPYLAKMIAGKFRYARKTGKEKPLRHAALKHGDNGGDSEKVLDYLRAMAADRAWRPDVLLLNCGLHDIKITPPATTRQVSISQYRRNVTEAIRLARRLAGEVVWIRTTHIDDAQHAMHCKSIRRRNADVSAYNRAADVITKSLGVKCIDLNGFTQRLSSVITGMLFIDHGHFIEPVRRLQAAYIAGGLEAIMDRR